MTAYVGGEVAAGRGSRRSGTRNCACHEARADSGTCQVVFRVAHTRVPGRGDQRVLGAHFNSFDYRP